MEDTTDSLRALSTSDLFAVLGDNAPARNLTASKTADCIKRDGSQITGFVVTDQWGGIGIIDKSAVRWLTNKEMWWLMHDSAQIGNNLDTANDQDVPTEGGENKP